MILDTAGRYLSVRGDMNPQTTNKLTQTRDVHRFGFESAGALELDNYLIFGNIESKSNNLSTSICGPTRFTGKLANAQFQLSIIEENVARIDELCGSAESGVRQIRIIRQDRNNIENVYS